MKKKSTLYILFFLLLSIGQLMAQTDTVLIDQVEITASRVPVTYSEVARVVAVIRRADINLAPVQSLNELLEYALNIDVRQRGPNGVQADIGIRGGSFEQTLILLNGIPFNDPQTGHHNLDLPVELSQIERIEILEGPGSRVFGPNAFCGAINIITSGREGNSVKAGISGGEHNLYTSEVSASVNQKAFSGYIAAGSKGSNGYISNTDYRTGNLFGSGTYKAGRMRFELQAGGQMKAFGANSFYTAKYPDQFEQTRTRFASLKFSREGNLKLSSSIYWKRHHDRFELFRDERPSWYQGHNYHLTDVGGAEANASFISPLGRTAFGASWRVEHIFSNVLGQLMNDTLSVPGEPEGKFTRSAQRQYTGIFAEHQVSLGNLSVSAGALLSFIPSVGPKLFPGVDAGYAINQSLKIFVTFNTSLRLPSFTDLYYVGPTNLGNPDLKPEQAISYETGLKFNKAGINGHVSVFRRDGRNIIDWVKSADSLKWQSRNLTRLQTDGFEFALNFQPASKLNADRFLQSAGVSYAGLVSRKQSNDLLSMYALDYLKHKITLSLRHRIFRNTGASWLFTWQDRAGKYADYASGDEKEYKPFAMLDARIWWTNTHLQIYLEASNVFNSAYIDLANIPMPGRWMRVGIACDFHWATK
ncbi:MAG TPA: TonB-dependent receptor [Bacteroidales bacterium]